MTSNPPSLRIGNRSIVTKRGTEPAVFRLRAAFICGLIVVLLAGVKLVDIQVINAEAYAETGVRQRVRTVELPATRGRIYDRDGEVLATSVDAATIYADPRAFRASSTASGIALPAAADAAAVAASLSELLDMEANDLEERLRRDAHFVYLGRQLPFEVGEAVQALRIPGIGVLTEPKRVYPGSTLAAQVLGFTGIDGEGLQGLEQRFDTVLVGEPGSLVMERALGGLEIPSGTRELIPATVGTDVVLTIDRQIQHAAEVAANEAMERHNASGAGVVVLEVASGDVLAMASTPGFDANNRSLFDGDTYRNRAATDMFEPGSVQKVFTLAAAIEEGLVSESTLMDTPQAVTIYDKRFGEIYRREEKEFTLTEILAGSSNVGTIMVAQDLGADRLDKYLRDFGFGVSTNSGFPGEAAGMLAPRNAWSGTSLPTIAIGQGIAVTLLQLASGFATIANDGMAVQPKIVRGTVGNDGRLAPVSQTPSRRVLSPRTSRQVRHMLEDAVTGDLATGGNARIDGYRVGGKTGTARKPNHNVGGYSSKYVATFVGMAPIDNPRFVVAVMVDEPKPAYYGGAVAAPVFREVMETALISRRVPAEAAGQDLQRALVDAQRLNRKHRETQTALVATALDN
ncbi:MAG: penicillin-binding protein 2 [Nitriliruptoraceae bacterium]